MTRSTTKKFKRFLAFIPLILCIILLTSIVSNVSVYAESPIQEIGFESADEVRRFILSTKENKMLKK